MEEQSGSNMSSSHCGRLVLLSSSSSLSLMMLSSCCSSCSLLESKDLTFAGFSLQACLSCSSSSLSHCLSSGGDCQDLWVGSLFTHSLLYFQQVGPFYGITALVPHHPHQQCRHFPNDSQVIATTFHL